MTRREGLIFIHSSDELYGADRMLLELLAALPAGVPAEVWLPNDLPHVDQPLCAELAARGHSARHLDLPILRRADQTPRGLLRLLGKARALAKELRARRPETVYCTTSAAFLAAPIARLSRVSRVIGHVQEIWAVSDRRVLGIAARACHTLLAISDAAAYSLPAGLRARTTVVPNATPEPERYVALDGRHGPLQFVIASRWNGWKGHRTLLAAWDQWDSPGRLTVLGGPPASGETVDVVDIVRRLHQPESVTIVGEVADPAPYLERADVVLVPSDQPEPFGLVAIEAFARGRPVIGSAGGGLVDIVTPEQDGWLFPPGDVEALAVLLGRLTRAGVTAAGAQARQTYQERFTTEQFAQRWRSAFAAGARPAK